MRSPPLPVPSGLDPLPGTARVTEQAGLGLSSSYHEFLAMGPQWQIKSSVTFVDSGLAIGWLLLSPHYTKSCPLSLDSQGAEG